MTDFISDILDKHFKEHSEELKEIQDEFAQAQRKWNMMTQAEQDKWREEHLYPKCHSHPSSFSGDTYGVSCNDCGHVIKGHGKNATQEWCTHEWEDTKKGTIYCYWCQSEYKNLEEAKEADYQLAKKTTALMGFFRRQQERNREK